MLISCIRIDASVFDFVKLLAMLLLEFTCATLDRSPVVYFSRIATISIRSLFTAIVLGFVIVSKRDLESVNKTVFIFQPSMSERSCAKARHNLGND